MAARYSNLALMCSRRHHCLGRCLLQSFQRLFYPRSIYPCPDFPCKRHLHSTFRNYSFSVANTRPLFLHVLKQEYGEKIAVVDSLGQHSYSDLLKHSTALAPYIIANAKRDNHSCAEAAEVTLDGDRIAFLCPNNSSYVITQWAIWMAGGMAVPLCKDHPSAEIEYVVEDSQSSLLISTSLYEQKIQSVAEKFDLKHLVLNEDALTSTANRIDSEGESLVDNIPQILHSHNANFLNLDVLERRVLRDKWHQIKWRTRNAMLIYTSGTTGRPKGVVTTFDGYQAQVAMMVQAWKWTASDIILHTLPLHHVHGVVNVLGCPLWVGATCVMLPKFDACKVWELLMSNDNPRINIFMAVPTIYAKLIEFYNTKYQASNVQAKAFIEALLKERIRLMVSGSAALPQPILEEWKQITGHTLLERYGMTELGMALSNPLHGQRVPGAVGMPMPSVEVRIVDNHGDVLVEGNSHKSEVKTKSAIIEGELQVKGPAVFKEYWNKPEATAETFTYDGWFKTGDTAKYEDGIYHIMGRTSVDIIKSGGYKISALDVERHLLFHPHIVECAVVGIPDVTWGQQVAAIVVLKPWSGLTLATLREWARDRMASYVIPTQLKVVEEIPRNAMGKVNKKQLLNEFFGVGQPPTNPTNARLKRVLSMKKE